ncbi:hypothetical protein BH11GEM2_BH11GEM2_18750 [soil metagenome]
MDGRAGELTHIPPVCTGTTRWLDVITGWPEKAES